MIENNMKLYKFFLCFCVIWSTFNECTANVSSNDLSLDGLPDLDLDNVNMNEMKNPDDIRQIKEWKDKCKADHGVEAVRRIEKAPNEMMECFLEYVKPDKLRVEVNKSIARGNLDRVFKKYCGYRNDITNCVDTMINHFRVCMTPQQLIDVNVTRKAIDAAIDFTCHDDGDRIALFMAEKGEECVNEHKDEIRECVQEKVPQIREAEDDPNAINIDDVVINEQQCGKILSIRKCIVDATTKCDDPTPSNILDSLMTQMIKVTPCNKALEAQSMVRSTASSPHQMSLSYYVKHAIASIGPIMCGLSQSILPTLCTALSSICELFCCMMLALGTLVHIMSGLTYRISSSCFNGVHSCMCHISEAIKNSVSTYFLVTHVPFSVSGLLVIALAGVTAANILI